jgi:Flp pilus assembly protein TadD
MRSFRFIVDIRILVGLVLLGPAMALAQATPTPAPPPTLVPTGSPSPTEVEEEEPANSPAGLREARKAIREGKLEEALTQLNALRAAGDSRPSVRHWTGIAYQKLGLLELAWRELHQAALFQPANRTYTNAVRVVEREILEPPPTPEVPPTPSASLPALLPPQDADGLRLRAERALRLGRSRLAAGLVLRSLEATPEAAEVLLLGVDAAMKDRAVVLARSLFDRHPQAKSAELEGLRQQLEALEKNHKPPRLEGPLLEQARIALDQLLLPQAMELLGKLRIQSPEDPEVLRLLASVHALGGDEQVARAFLSEAELDEPGLRRFLAKIELLEDSPLRPAHQTLLEPAEPVPTPATPDSEP